MSDLAEKRQELIKQEVSDFNKQITWFLDSLILGDPKEVSSIKVYKFPESLDLDSFLEKALDPNVYRFKHLDLPLIDQNEFVPLRHNLKYIDVIKLASLIKSISLKLDDPETSVAIKNKFEKRLIKCLLTINHNTDTFMASILPLFMLNPDGRLKRYSDQIKRLNKLQNLYVKKINDRSRLPLNKIRIWLGLKTYDIYSYERYLNSKWKREVDAFYLSLL